MENAIVVSLVWLGCLCAIFVGGLLLAVWDYRAKKAGL